MKLIKAAITYKATIPTNTDTLANHLDKFQFTECMEAQLRSIGFVPVTDGELVERFAGGFAFRVRVDDKIIPSAAVKVAVDKAVHVVEEATGRKVGKKERREIKEGVMFELAKRALVKTTASVICYYVVEKGFLIVATGSKAIADVCVSLLIQAVGSVKTETLHVSDAKHGLTTRMKSWVEDDEGFGNFEPCDEVALVSEGRTVSVKMSSLQQARSAITEALTAGFSVKSIGFHLPEVNFRLTSEFRLNRIAFTVNDLENDEDSYWAAEAAIQVKAVSEIIGTLVEMLTYKDEQDAEESTTKESN